MCTLIRSSLCLILSFMFTLPALAALPPTLNYQGYLTNPAGTPVNAPVAMTFRLYNAASGGVLLYTEAQPSVPVTNGSFSAILGVVAPIALAFDVPYWLSVQVNTDPEMSPRQPLTSSAYAFRAAALDAAASISGAQITGTITANGNIDMVASTAGAGNITKGGNTFLHNFGSSNTFIGSSAGNFSMTGNLNTGSGAFALASNSSGSSNTASGANALFANTSGILNSASGKAALQSNTTGTSNTANGADALLSNTTGDSNTASGAGALNLNTIGGGNVATGKDALRANTTGFSNTAHGTSALYANSTANFNVATGTQALFSNTTGFSNSAAGTNALYDNTTGSNNIGIGIDGGRNLTTGNDNIAIGHAGVAAETSTTRIGTFQSKAFIAGIRGITTIRADAIAVLIDSAGQLGTVSSSRTVKDDIADMNDASTIISQLRPVTFRYKMHGHTDDRPRQYGLIAEEVAEVAPELVARNAQGEIETVFYQHLTPMLLNEFQKQQARINALERELATIRALMIANMAKSSTGEAFKP